MDAVAADTSPAALPPPGHSVDTIPNVPLTVRRPTVFVGSSSEARDVAHRLQVRLEDDESCEVRVWDQGTFGASEYGLGSLVAAARAADFAVLVATPDDTVTSREMTAASPRDNVLFELGLFMGALGVERVFILSPAAPLVRLPSDLDGLTRLKPYGGRQDGDLSASLTGAALQIRDAIVRLGPRAAVTVPGAAPENGPGVARPPAPLPMYGPESMFANDYPGRFTSMDQNRPAVHLRAVWRPTLTGLEPGEFSDSDTFESTVPSVLLERWAPFFAKNGGAGGVQPATIDGMNVTGVLLVADQDLANSTRSAPQASVRAAIALLNGGPALRFVADLSLDASSPLPFDEVLMSLKDLAVHATVTMPNWLKETHGVMPAADGELEVHAVGSGALRRPGVAQSLEAYVDFSALGPRSRTTRVTIGRATHLQSVATGEVGSAVADSVLKSLLNWGYLAVPKSTSGNVRALLSPGQ